MKRYRLVPLARTPGEGASGDGEALLERLNPAQAEAARATEGPVLVVAGAGTGKTRTLTYRTAYLVARGVAPEHILLLTFTRRASEVMRQRAGLLLDARCDRVQGGTFHATACGLLRRFGGAIGLEPGFTILDRPDAEDVVGLVRSELELAGKGRLFPKKRTLLDIISKAVNRDVTVEETVSAEYPHFAEHLGDILRLAARYRDLKRARQMVDYDDLLTHVVTLLSEHPAERERIGALYRYLMVDEYQDTNRIQARMVRLLAVGHDNVMAVGDDAQSIYAFRGACFKNIMDFPADFPGARIVKLTENYRSTPEVLGVANAIIARAQTGYRKALTTGRAAGPTPSLVRASTENLQSRYVCQRILELHEEGTPLSDIAVLFRSAYHTFDLEVELARHALPFVKRGGLKFMETAHVKDVVAYLRVLENPGDAVSWVRVLRLHPGVGEVTAQRMFTHITAQADPWTALSALPEGWQAKVPGLADLLAPLARGGNTPTQVVEQVIAHYTPQLTALYDDHPKRIKDLDQLLALSERYDALEPFLTDLALEPPEASVAGLEAQEDPEHLTLSTVHSAKGLEWSAVFVIWAVDGRFPSAYAEGTVDEMEEERRLMYVAVTRAKDRLAITYPVGVYDRTTGLVLSKPSRFIEGIGPDVLEPWALTDETEPMAPEGAPRDDGFDAYFNQEAGW